MKVSALLMEIILQKAALRNPQRRASTRQELHVYKKVNGNCADASFSGSVINIITGLAAGFDGVSTVIHNGQTISDLHLLKMSEATAILLHVC